LPGVAVMIVLVGACIRSEEPTRLADLMTPGRVVVVGEIHGTVEFPRAVESAVTTAASRKTAVRLGLEIPRDETAAFATYIDSDGTRRDRAELTRSPFWTKRDGRASDAMLELVETVRTLRASGSDVDLLLFDVPRTRIVAKRRADHRDELMSERIAEAVRADPMGAFIVLVGNFHAGKAVASTDELPRYEPMARLLSKAVPDTFTVLGTHAGGTAWVCTTNVRDCGPQRLEGDDEGERPPYVTVEPPSDGFDASVFVGPIHASAPPLSA
jgi:hypothetical protein